MFNLPVGLFIKSSRMIVKLCYWLASLFLCHLVHHLKCVCVCVSVVLSLFPVSSVLEETWLLQVTLYSSWGDNIVLSCILCTSKFPAHLSWRLALMEVKFVESGCHCGFCVPSSVWRRKNVRKLYIVLFYTNAISYIKPFRGLWLYRFYLFHFELLFLTLQQFQHQII